MNGGDLPGRPRKPLISLEKSGLELRGSDALE